MSKLLELQAANAALAESIAKLSTIPVPDPANPPVTNADLQPLVDNTAAMKASVDAFVVTHAPVPVPSPTPVPSPAPAA